MIKNKTKILIGIGVLSAFALSAYIIKIQNDISKRQEDINTKIIEYKKLEDGLARIESRQTTDKKDLEKSLKEFGVNYSKIQKDLDDHNAKLEAISVSIGRTEGYIRSNSISDWQEPIDDSANPQPSTPPDPTCSSQYGYCTKIQGLNLYEQGINNDKIPFGSVGFNATSSAPWNLSVYPRKYYSILSLGKKSDGTTIAYSQMYIEDKDGNKHKIAIDEKSFYEQVDKTYRFYWWNPRIMAGYGVGARFNNGFSSIINAQLYTSSYTANQSRPTWSFFGAGIGYDLTNSSVIGTVSPVAYNLFHTTDLIQNFYVAPVISLSFLDSSIGVHASASLIF